MTDRDNRSARFPYDHPLIPDPVTVYVVVYPDARDRDKGESVAVFRLPEGAAAFARRNAGRVDRREIAADEYRRLAGKGQIL